MYSLDIKQGRTTWLDIDQTLLKIGFIKFSDPQIIFKAKLAGRGEQPLSAFDLKTMPSLFITDTMELDANYLQAFLK